MKSLTERLELLVPKRTMDRLTRSQVGVATEARDWWLAKRAANKPVPTLEAVFDLMVDSYDVPMTFTTFKNWVYASR